MLCKISFNSDSAVLTVDRCASGAAFDSRYHPTFITFPKSLAEFFADRAKALLEIELDSPSIATVQALVILSGHEAVAKRDARGWLFSGMSMRLAFDLGLHVDMAPYVEKGLITEAEAEIRRITFWGSFLVDHLWGFYLGRPFRVNTEDVTVKKLALNSKGKVGRWAPYGCAEAHPPSITAGMDDPIELISRNWVTLCEIVAPVGHILYSCSEIKDRHALQILTSSTVAKLLEWHNTLDPDLQVNVHNDSAPYLPHVLMMQ